MPATRSRSPVARDHGIFGWGWPGESSSHPCPRYFSNLLLISILYRVIRYPILLILASERSRGIFYRPAARACEGSRLDRAGILVGRQRAPAGSTAGAGRRLPGMMTRHTYFPLFSVSHLKTFPVLYLSPHPCRNSLFSVRSPGEYICGILFGRCTSATSSAGS